MPKTVILLVNLGTPLSPSPKDVKKYLTEFLTDPRVINLPWIYRQALVRGIIIPRRLKTSSQSYKSLWTNKGSPLLVYGRSCQELLQKKLGENYDVRLAMRYQFPGIKETLSSIKKEVNCQKIVVLPLFPQYASATTGSVIESVCKQIKTWNTIPSLKMITSFYDNPLFLKAWKNNTKNYNLQNYDHILMSFHGLPEKQIQIANPKNTCLKKECCNSITKENTHCYKAQCFATAQGVANQLGLAKEKYSVTFQSRLGKSSWIKPYLDDTLQKCITNNQKRLLVFPLSFVTDCLETTIEIGVEYQEKFQLLGGTKLDLVPSLNSSPHWIDTLAELSINK
jgi:protoporphyrin/coproporphyrin ferrochelatase